jgi:alkylation response protein AidB-like acyl-CoA dehydrogenase
VDLRYSEADEKFRKDLRGWLSEAVPAHGPSPDMADWAARREYDTGWQRKLFDAGYAGINWPREYGGRDASLTEQLIYYEEISRANAPYIGVNFVGMLHGGPTIITEGSDHQKEMFIGPILRGEMVWCQGFSEPTAGSDLASLKTRADRDGDFYVLNGHKIWTSFAQVADYCEMLGRTDPNAPKPTLTGEGEFSEVFFENVRVPVDCRVGQENDGWRVTNVTLSFERGTAFASDMIQLQQIMRDLIALSKSVTRNGASAWEDRALRRELGHLAAEADALWAMVKWTVSEVGKTGIPGAAASCVKLYYTELKQRIGDLAFHVLGRAGLSRDQIPGSGTDFVYEALQSLSMTIAAGSSQINRNIISERILELPREPR